MIYFLAAAELGRIKIGYARNVSRRMLGVRDGSPTPLKLLLQVDGTRYDEAALHRKFAFYRAHGEWFHADPALTGFCRELASCSGDAQSAFLAAAVKSQPSRRRLVEGKFDKTAERIELSSYLQSFIAKHGEQAFREIANVGKQTVKLIKRGCLLGAPRIVRLMRHDYQLMAPYFGEIEELA